MLIKTEDRPASLRAVPQLNEPICTAVRTPWTPRSHQYRRSTRQATPALRQIRATTGRLIRNRSPAQPIGGRPPSVIAYFTATALPPQMRQQTVAAESPA